VRIGLIDWEDWPYPLAKINNGDIKINNDTTQGSLLQDG
jgi:hypothetical protein